ncbi:DNA-binding response regulator [Terrimonas sp.]|uniref:response regulator transcription factor n=1 Tax=Terrimonas sp. TaxID=1914338 RepID=UPI000D514223|nr:response regulator transcription factor [Terrimonas sp.]PVD51815.1 DNA-binding response regulator [Terrimonas sp.]
MKDRILFVEDEHDLGNVVKQYLEVMDFDVLWVKHGRDALDNFKLNSGDYSIVILDIGLPEMDGFELAGRILKISPDIPFLFLTARNEKADKLYGLKIGADDYVTKPFDIDELVLRIQNIIRRKGSGMSTVSANTIVVGDVFYNKDALQLKIGSNAPVFLTRREAELLEYLLLRSDKVLKREEILTQLWGENDYFLGRSLDVFISRLRKLLAASDAVSINNVYGVGFIVNIKKV